MKKLINNSLVYIYIILFLSFFCFLIGTITIYKSNEMGNYYEVYSFVNTCYFICVLLLLIFILSIRKYKKNKEKIYKMLREHLNNDK